MFFLSKENRPSIILTDDLIKIWAEKTGKSEEVLRDILKHHHDYLNKKINEDPTAIIINIPWIGKLRFNYYLGLSYLSAKKKKNKVTDIVHQKVTYLREILKKDGRQIKNFNRPAVYRQYLNLTKEFSRRVYDLFYIMWKKLEDEHNDDYNKKNKSSF